MDSSCFFFLPTTSFFCCAWLVAEVTGLRIVGYFKLCLVNQVALTRSWHRHAAWQAEVFPPWNASTGQQLLDAIGFYCHFKGAMFDITQLFSTKAWQHVTAHQILKLKIILSWANTSSHLFMNLWKAGYSFSSRGHCECDYVEVWAIYIIWSYFLHEANFKALETVNNWLEMRLCSWLCALYTWVAAANFLLSFLFVVFVFVQIIERLSRWLKAHRSIPACLILHLYCSLSILPVDLLSGRQKLVMKKKHL